MTPVRYTNLFPTRYEAFDTPGVFFVFKADDDGTFFHCRRDSGKSSIANITAHKFAELAVFCDGNGKYAEVFPTRTSTFRADCSRDRNTRRDVTGSTMADVIRKACTELQIDPPEWETT